MAAASRPQDRAVVVMLRVRAGADKVAVLAAIATSEIESDPKNGPWSVPIRANPICA
jgi:hypothetical protein